MAEKVISRRNVKSGADAAADAHERRKDFLTAAEIDRLDAAKAGRHGPRDHLLLLMMYRHGLRVSEATALRRDEVDVAVSRLWVRRLKNGLSVEQPIAATNCARSGVTSAGATITCLGCSCLSAGLS
nr:tyrosine-type recombinase/integrase [Sphingobium sp. LB126]